MRQCNSKITQKYKSMAEASPKDNVAAKYFNARQLQQLSPTQRP